MADEEDQGEDVPYSKEDLDRMRKWGDVVPTQYLVKRFMATVDGLQGRLRDAKNSLRLINDELDQYRSNHKMVELRRQLTNKAVECDGLLSMLRIVCDGLVDDTGMVVTVDIPRPIWERIKTLFPALHTHKWEVQDTTTVHPQPKAGPVKVRVSYRCSCGGARFKEFELTLEDSDG